MVWALVISILLLAHVYVGYPALMWVLAGGCGRPVRKGAHGGPVAVLIAARNEAETLPRKLENLLALAKTEPIREIWIGLDGCTDDTGPRIRRVAGAAGDPEWVHLVEYEAARGKAAVLNDLMAQAGQPIWVMMDARQRVEPGAIGKLLENFADDRVGVVSGALVYESAAGGAQKGAESYWGYEKFLRNCESRFWAVPGATGALYAIRRELCHPIPENTLVDDVLIPMRAVLAGFRCLFEPAARVFDLPSAHFDQEGLRKRRTLAGIWQIVHLEPRIFSIFANPIWFQWISHKFLRLWTPLLLSIAYLSLGLLAREGGVGFRSLFWAVTGGMLVSLAAYVGGKKTASRWLGMLGAVFGVNLALVLAAGDAWTGRFEARWKA